MKTFYEHFLDEISRKLAAGEIDAEKARRWIDELQQRLRDYAQRHPTAPIVQMPLKQ